MGPMAQSQRYFDGPEKYVSEKVVPGFGPYGYSPGIQGPTTAEFVTAVQSIMKEEIARLSAVGLSGC